MDQVFDRDKLERVNQIFQERLFDEAGDRVRDYLTEDRHLDVERLRPFEVGYCPPEVPYPLRGHAVVEGRMWAMRGRLVVPIRDEFGEIVAFAGRKLDWCDGRLENALTQEFGVDRADAMMEKWRNGKWINEMYHKKHHLYRLWNCRRSLAEVGHVIIVEGYFDAIALADAGFPNTVCLSGTKLTFWHIQALRHYGVEHIVMCLDSDESGVEATEESERAYEGFGTTCRIVLPQGLDPDEAIVHPRHGPILRWALRVAGDRRGGKPITVDSVETRLAARNDNNEGTNNDQD